MKVQNMIDRSGRAVPNQFIINATDGKYFQSYKNTIALISSNYSDKKTIYLDVNYWKYSHTTSKYRNMFLNMTTQEIKKAIKDGTIKLVNLNSSGV